MFLLSMALSGDSAIVLDAGRMYGQQYASDPSTAALAFGAHRSTGAGA
jgi:hypothetical protein